MMLFLRYLRDWVMCPTCQAFPFPFTFPHLLSLHPLSSLHLVFIAISTPCISYASTFLLLSPTPSTLSSVFPIVSFLGPCPPPPLPFFFSYLFAWLKFCPPPLKLALSPPLLCLPTHCNPTFHGNVCLLFPSFEDFFFKFFQ